LLNEVNGIQINYLSSLARVAAPAKRGGALVTPLIGIELLQLLLHFSPQAHYVTCGPRSGIRFYQAIKVPLAKSTITKSFPSPQQRNKKCPGGSHTMR